MNRIAPAVRHRLSIGVRSVSMQGAFACRRCFDDGIRYSYDGIVASRTGSSQEALACEPTSLFEAVRVPSAPINDHGFPLAPGTTMAFDAHDRVAARCACGYLFVALSRSTFSRLAHAYECRERLRIFGRCDFMRCHVATNLMPVYDGIGVRTIARILHSFFVGPMVS